MYYKYTKSHRCLRSWGRASLVVDFNVEKIFITSEVLSILRPAKPVPGIVTGLAKTEELVARAKVKKEAKRVTIII